MERMIFYPGCLVLSRFHEYELASKQILKKLDIGPWIWRSFAAVVLPWFPGPEMIGSTSPLFWFDDNEFNELRELFGLSAIRFLGREKVAIFMSDEGKGS